MTDKTIYVHLGPTKTGTSALQRFLSSNDSLLMRLGYHYPQTLRDDKEGSHNLLAYLIFFNLHKSLPHNQVEPLIPRKKILLKKFANEISNNSSPKTIISSESFLFLPDTLQNLTQTILEIFPKAKIKGIIYIRNIMEWSHSHISEMVKKPPTNSSSNFLRYIDLQFSIWLRTFRQELNKFSSIIGKQNLIFRKYGKQYFYGGNIFNDFLYSVGLKPADRIPYDSIGIINKSLKTAETLYFKDHLNRLDLPIPEKEILSTLFNWEANNQGTKFHLPQNTRPTIEKEAGKFCDFMLNNFLPVDFTKILGHCKIPSPKQEFILSQEQTQKMVNYLDSRIKGFKDRYHEAILQQLETAFFYRKHLAGIKNQLNEIIKNGKCALWGCGAAAEELFRQFNFIFEDNFLDCVIDTDTTKQYSQFHSLEIIPPSLIPLRGVDTILIGTPTYAEEIVSEIKTHYPSIHSVIKLDNIRLATERIRPIPAGERSAPDQAPPSGNLPGNPRRQHENHPDGEYEAAPGEE